MNVEPRHLVQALVALGIRLEADGDGLIVDAPRGALTSALRATLTDHKAELLALLRRSDVPEVAEGREHGPEDCPPDELTAVDRATINAGRRVRPDGTFPPSMRPRFGCGPPAHERIVSGVMVPGGWTTESWAARLVYMARVCIRPARAAELREWVSRLAPDTHNDTGRAVYDPAEPGPAPSDDEAAAGQNVIPGVPR